MNKIVNITEPTKQKPKTKKNEILYFCPYCEEWVKTTFRNSYKVLACCGISLNDFAVRKVNKLFEKARR